MKCSRSCCHHRCCCCCRYHSNNFQTWSRDSRLVASESGWYYLLGGRVHQSPLPRETKAHLCSWGCFVFLLTSLWLRLSLKWWRKSEQTTTKQEKKLFLGKKTKTFCFCFSLFYFIFSEGHLMLTLLRNLSAIHSKNIYYLFQPVINMWWQNHGHQDHKLCDLMAVLSTD